MTHSKHHAAYAENRTRKKYDPKEFTFDRLKNEFDIFAVRGPRGIPDSLSKALNA